MTYIDVKKRYVSKDMLMKQFANLKKQGKVDTMFENNFTKDFENIQKTTIPKNVTSRCSTDRAKCESLSSPEGAIYLEPMMIFKGRGKHPLRGKIKRAVEEKDVIVNLKGEEKLKGETRFRGTTRGETWRLKWRDTLTGNLRYQRVISEEQKDERPKFELARKLKRRLPKFRSENRIALESKDKKTAQCATAAYLIDSILIRVGNEKDENTCETMGCCTLEVQNVTLKEKRKVRFEFLGKDSVPFRRDITVLETVYSNLIKFTRNKINGDQIFDLIDTAMLNRYLSKIVPDVTAKVFRICNASVVFERGLREEKTMEGYKRVNEIVANMLNHKKYDNKKKKWVSSLMTSRINYLDPRISVDFCKRNGILIEQVWGSTGKNRYKWAEKEELPFKF